MIEIMDAALVFLLCLLVGSLEANDCPPKEDVWPCTCALSKFETHLKDVECRSLSKPEELLPPVQALRKSKTRVYRLRIENSTLSYLPDNLFQDIYVKEVYFANTKIIHLSEHQTAFIGLENVLESICAVDVDFVTGLHLDQLDNLNKLRTIVFDRCRIHSAVPSLPYLPTLIGVHITNSGISLITNNAFRDLPNLSGFDMSNNELTEMKRNMFPKPAEHLWAINLSGNRLSSLPNDFFVNMPELQNVYLQNNKFVTMDERPFTDVFRNDKLRLLEMTGNHLHCDCKLSWLGGVGFPQYFFAKCATPEALSGKEVLSLDFQSLRLQTCHSGLLESLLASERLPT